ncbi:MAG: serine hydrolase [Myxococcota bacterium]
MERGLVEDLDRSIASFFPELPKNSALQKIKIRDVLDMTSGLDADTDDPRTVGHFSQWIAKANWTEALLRVPLARPPGKTFVYADLNPSLIGAIIEKRSGMSLEAFARKHLFGPLGIQQLYWYSNRSGQTAPAGNLYLTTLDFARLGSLVLNEGVWKGQRIIGAAYIERLMRHSIDIEGDNPFADRYGMFWYRGMKRYQKKSIDIVFASGNGGNVLAVIPELETVIAVTSSAYGQGYGHQRSHNVISRIIDALR